MIIYLIEYREDYTTQSSGKAYKNKDNAEREVARLNNQWKKQFQKQTGKESIFEKYKISEIKIMDYKK